MALHGSLSKSWHSEHGWFVQRYCGGFDIDIPPHVMAAQAAIHDGLDACS